jgi:hypothetical protein
MTAHIFKLNNGGIGIKPNSKKLTVEQVIEKLHQNPRWIAEGLRVVSFHEIPFETIPQTAKQRYEGFRDAWTDLGPTGPVVDIPKARGIHMDRIRKAREPEFKRLDEAYLRADESGDSVSKRAIAAEKQKLRDLPQTFDLSTCTTAAELHALWPSILPARNT